MSTQVALTPIQSSTPENIEIQDLFNAALFNITGSNIRIKNKNYSLASLGSQAIELNEFPGSATQHFTAASLVADIQKRGSKVFYQNAGHYYKLAGATLYSAPTPPPPGA